MFLSGAVDLRFDAEPVDSAVWDVAWTKLALEVPRELFWRMLNRARLLIRADTDLAVTKFQNTQAFDLRGLGDALAKMGCVF